jgi:hypothetical protein
MLNKVTQASDQLVPIKRVSGLSGPPSTHEATHTSGSSRFRMASK